MPLAGTGVSPATGVGFTASISRYAVMNARRSTTGDSIFPVPARPSPAPAPRRQPRCQACHDPKQRINGVLVFDMNTPAMTAGMNRDLRMLVLGTGAIALLLIAVIAVVVRIVLLRRLQRFETTASLIAKGDLDKRVPAEGSDTISWLAREFNTMADSMTGLVDQVNGQQRRLVTIINSIDDGIVVLDPDMRVVAANDAFVARAGRPREELIGKRCLRGPGTPAGILR